MNLIIRLMWLIMKTTRLSKCIKDAVQNVRDLSIKSLSPSLSLCFSHPLSFFLSLYTHTRTHAYLYVYVCFFNQVFLFFLDFQGLITAVWELRMHTAGTWWSAITRPVSTQGSKSTAPTPRSCHPRQVSHTHPMLRVECKTCSFHFHITSMLDPLIPIFLDSGNHWNALLSLHWKMFFFSFYHNVTIYLMIHLLRMWVSLKLEQYLRSCDLCVLCNGR